MYVAVVDDQASSHAGFSQILSRIANVKPICFALPGEALYWLGGVDPVFIVVSATLPQIDGLEFIRRLRMMTGRRETPVLLTAAKLDRDSRRTAFELDVFAILEKPINPSEFLTHARHIVDAYATRNELERRLAAADHRAILTSGAGELQSDDDAIETMRTVAALHDPTMRARMDMSSALAGVIAAELRLNNEERATLAKAARIYDIGKVAIPQHLLESRTPILPGDRIAVEAHAEAGARLLEARGTAVMRAAAVIAQTHHERFDGNGYPRKLRGAAIPIFGRIVAVCDTIAALVSPRADRDAIPLARVIELVEKQSGHAYDPTVIVAMRSGLGEISRIVHEAAQPRAIA